MEFRRSADRKVAPALWDKHKVEITALYRGGNGERALTLPRIRQHFSQAHNFDPSTKLWKAQLDKWGLRKNMDIDIITAIAYLYQEADEQHITRRVYFQGILKQRSDLEKYTKKTKAHRDLKYGDLLNRRPSTQNWRKYVTWKDGDEAGEAGEAQHNPEQESSDNGADQDYAVQSAYNPTLNICHQNMMPGSSQSEGNIGQPEPLWAPDISNHPNTGGGWYNMAESEDTVMINPLSSPIYYNMFDPRGGIDHGYGFFPPAIHHEATQHDLAVTRSDQERLLESLGPLLSATPIALRIASPLDERLLTEQLSYVIDAMLGLFSKKLSPLTARFIRNCCQASIFAGQELDVDGQQILEIVYLRDNAVRNAVNTFAQVQAQEQDESLNVLNLMRYMLENYGHTDLQGKILRRVREVVRTPDSHSGALLRATIDFWIDTLDWNHDLAVQWLPKMEKVYKQVLETTADEASSQALAAKCNLAWVCLEAGELQRGFDILNQDLRICQNTFGIDHLQTIVWLAQLSRAHMYMKSEFSGEAILEETVLPRVRKMFTEKHPYYHWVKYRQGLYKLVIADRKNIQQSQRDEYWREGTQLLRGVLIWRAHVLGIDNPETATVFKWLKEYLKKQGLEEEAQNLRQATIETLKTYRGA